MFRNLLLVTTALLAVASMTPTEAQNIAGAHADRMAARHMALEVAHRGHDKNTEFLCTYGGYDVSAGWSSSSETLDSSWKQVAVPIRGHGRAVDTIVVHTGTSDPKGSRQFSAGIYGNTLKDRPGNLIAGGKSRAGQHCGKREIAIPRTVLEDGKKYWVVESVPRPTGPRGGARNLVSWGIDPVARDDAYSQYHTFSYSYPSSGSSYTSPWRRIKTGRAPFVRVR